MQEGLKDLTPEEKEFVLKNLDEESRKAMGL